MKLLVIDSDYTYSVDNKPIIRIYGKKVGGVREDRSEEDIVVHIYGFEPYIYVDDCGFDVGVLKGMIEKELRGYIKDVSIVQRYKPMGYQLVKSSILKIVLWNPKVVPEVRRLLVDKIEEISDSKIYEADIVFRDRFLIDIGIDGMSIIEFNEVGKRLKNYGVGCSGGLYMVEVNDIKICKDEVVKVEY